MNAFRITILVLLTAAVALMFYFIQVSQPAMQNQSEAYWANKRSEDMRRQAAKGKEPAPAAESAVDEALARKRAEQEKAAKEQADAEFREMERRTVEEQTRQEQARRAKEAQDTVVKTPIAGRIYSFNEFENVVTIESTSGQVFNPGLNVFILREGKAIGEATVDSKDPETGLYFAYMRNVEISTKKGNIPPQQGDQVMVVDIPTSADLRGGKGQVDPLDVLDEDLDAPAPEKKETPAPAPKPLPALDDVDDDDYGLPSLPEVDAPLTPVK